MKFITSLILLAAAYVSAKPSGTAECAAIYQRCIETITPQECKKTDRDCLCKAWDDVITLVLTTTSVDVWSTVQILLATG
ncbi:hypothetical protein CEK26_013274 [Fusarium fujikuroi]|uniref:Uncharacterized protein n=1 Tax=Fusarium fujikuroi TaxID=5127 RepID=A0A5Q3F5Z2_FUSFU|nr:hypothetical protein CEK27_013288 [Fusarium fujikuroi]QGI86681.1 hypothetical protein CEK25_013410 [Fusarium fujikuroi]QGJ00206.1 hypothetical protein CEK26_013274 [Fusarium fujikuroi]VTT74189.1 unnamed protein product [Fusarium fujikuroi]VTT81366.1 unnamed protein product [Fusarium fujikuroi]